MRDAILLGVGALIGLGAAWLKSRWIDQPHQRWIRREIEREAAYKAVGNAIDPIAAELAESAHVVEAAATLGGPYTANWWPPIDDDLFGFEHQWEADWQHTLRPDDTMTGLYRALHESHIEALMEMSLPR